MLGSLQYKTLRIGILTSFLLFIANISFLYAQVAQHLLHSKTGNYSTFSADKKRVDVSQSVGTGDVIAVREISDLEMLERTSTEIIEKRTRNSKYYVDNNNPSKFTQLFSYGGSLNYEKNGKWLSADQKIQSLGNGKYIAEHQKEPVGFNVNTKTAFIETIAGRVNFNNWSLIGAIGGKESLLAFANWSNYSAGDDGIMIYNIFPGIDAEMKVQFGAIKTNFIINENRFPAVEKFIFKDDFNSNENLGKLSYGANAKDQGKASFLLNNQPVLNINRAIVYTELEASKNYMYLAYAINNNSLAIALDASYINLHLPFGKIIIDPLVEGTATLQESEIAGSMNCGSSSNYCAYNFNVPTPPNATLLGISLKWGFYAKAPSAQNQGFFSLSSGGCNSGNFGVVNPQTSNGPGTVSTLGEFVPITSLFSCLPSASCVSQNVPLELRFFNTYCAAGTGCSDTYVKANEPLVIKIEGRTLEYVSVTPTQTICSGSSATITVDPAYGVKPYTYKWSNGETAKSIQVSPTISTTYTVITTDNCGNTLNANIRVNVNSTPVIQRVSSNSPLCSGSQLALSTPLLTGATYSWTGPGNFSSTSPAPTLNNVTTSQSGIYTLRITVNGCTSAPVSTNVEINPTVTPFITIAASETNSCSGSTVSFTATTLSAGVSPSYQWQKNGLNVGTNSITYVTNTLADNDVVICILTNNSECTTVNTAKSNEVSVRVTPTVMPQVAIAANSSSTICEGTIITFTATIANGGTSPKYQWLLNGNEVGTDNDNYTTANLKDGDVVSCRLTSNAACATQTIVLSNEIKFKVTALVTPTAVIVASTNSICAGTTVSFKATSTYGGTAPTYRWLLNGSNVGQNNDVYVSSTLNNGDVITCVIKSDLACVTNSEANSNSITMTVGAAVSPTITITTPSTKLCLGTLAYFTASITNGGTPTYQWKVNDINVGANSATFSDNNLVDGDVVTCILTSTVACATSQAVASNAIKLTVGPILVPAVSIQTSSPHICAGSPTKFTAIAVNCGSTPTYIWQINGRSMGQNSSNFTSAMLLDGDIVTCTVVCDPLGCYTNNQVVSNEIQVTVNPVPSISMTKEITVFKGASFKVEGTVSGNIASYQWSPETYLSNSEIANPIITPLKSITYTFQATNFANCTATQIVNVRVLNKIEVPNTFTPNGDGTNDTWVIKGLEDYAGATIDVYHRNGQHLYHGANNKAWDGTFKGKQLPGGTYYYLINPKNNLAVLSGWLVILL